MADILNLNANVDHKRNLINSPKTENKKKSLHQISFLRAIASISVCVFHLSYGNTSFLVKSNFILKTFSYGYLGVQVFFILSGFIICYSLPPNYQLKNFFSFLKKRLIRVEPPYLLSIFLTLGVAYISAFVTNNLVEFSWKNLLYHIGYLNSFTKSPYINPVYWTLGIEFQFYTLIGLLFPLMKKSVYFLILIITSLLLLNLMKFSDGNLIFAHTPFFCAGIISYFISCSIQYPKWILICLLVVTLLTITLNRPEVIYVSFFAICILALPFRYNTFVQFFSNISYSLYLIHVPIGGRIINLSLRFVKTDNQKYLAIATAFITSIIAAYLFYLVVEKPAIKWSKKIRYFCAN